MGEANVRGGEAGQNETVPETKSAPETVAAVSSPGEQEEVVFY